MSNNNIYNVICNKNETSLLLNKGIWGEKLFLFCRDEHFYIQIADTQCFKVSIRRIKNTMSIKSVDEIKRIFIKYIKNIKIEKQNSNLFYLNIMIPQKTTDVYNINYKIKLKEINDFLNITQVDNYDNVIKKQNEKILLLLEKIKKYEELYKEPR